MKKLAASAVVIALLVLVPAQAASADLLGDLGSGDLTAGLFPDDQFTTLSSSGHPFTVGGGTAGVTHFAFSAHNGSKGPSGYAVIKHPTLGRAQGHVVCYVGNTPFGGGQLSMFGIEIEKATGFLASPFHPILTFSPFDSGQPGGAGDFLRIDRFPAPCFPGDPIVGPAFVTQGNIVIKN